MRECCSRRKRRRRRRRRRRASRSDFCSADAKRENKQTKDDDAEKIKKKKNIKDDDDDCFRSIRPRCRRRRRPLSREDSMLISIALVLLSSLCNLCEDFIRNSREEVSRIFCST